MHRSTSITGAIEGGENRRRRGTRETTRERLIQAAIGLIREGGIGAISTVSVTQAAGFSQSSFYIHFQNVDDCLEAAAERVAGEVRAFVAEHRRQSHQAAAQNPGAGFAHFQAVLHLFLKERQFAELLLRYRYDLSPLGRVMGQLVEQIRSDYLADAWQLARRYGIGDEHYDHIAIQSEFVLANVMAAGEALLAGRFVDVDLLATELAYVTDAIVRQLASRCVKGT